MSIAEKLDVMSEEIDIQEDLIAQAMSLLDGKAVGGGMSDNWELINSLEQTDSTEVSSMIFNKDSSNASFSLKKAILYVVYPKYTGGSTLPTYNFPNLSGHLADGTNGVPMVYTNFVIPSSTNNKVGFWSIDWNEGMRHEIHVYGSIDDSMVSSLEMAKVGFVNNVNTSGYYNLRKIMPPKEDDVSYPITSIGIGGGNNSKLVSYQGCKFYLWGVRE